MALLVLAGCGASRSTLVGPGQVGAVLPVTAAPGVTIAAPVSGTVQLLTARRTPREVVRATLVRGLQDRGLQILAESATRGSLATLRARCAATPRCATPKRVAAALGVDYVVVPVVEAWDTTHISKSARMALALDLRVFSRDGRLVWQGKSPRTVVMVALYKARQDYRMYVRAAVGQLLRQFP